jgi:VanZ family protein
MLLIFSASTENLSSNNTSRVIGPLLQWFQPNIRAETISSVQTLVRKSGHLFEYAVLALLIWRAIHKPGKTVFRPTRWSEIILTLWVVILYAGSDEFHQSFVPTRQASFSDVLLDTFGAVMGLLFLWFWRRKQRFGIRNPRL